MNNIGAVIKRCGLTQRQVAERMGITTQAISMWVTGKRNPKRTTLLRLAKACNVPISELFGEAEEKPRDVSAELIVTCKDVDSDIGRERGWRDVWYQCPSCNVIIAVESWDRVYCFGSSTIMKDNRVPAFCPECGQKIVKATPKEGANQNV